MRAALVESARIARGTIRDVATVRADELKGADCRVHPEVAEGIDKAVSALLDMAWGGWSKRLMPEAASGRSVAPWPI